MQLSLDDPDGILIWLYDKLDQLFAQTELPLYTERFSNNAVPDFTDAELFTTAIFPILMGYPIKKDGHRYVRRHYHRWFPKLPTYEVWNRRLNHEHEALAYLFHVMLKSFAAHLGHQFIVDTFPVSVCQAQHASGSRAAQPFVSKGYCAAKKKYYIGAKVEILAAPRPGQLPMLGGYFIATAKTHDLKIAQNTLADLTGVVLYGDKAFVDQSFQLELFENYSQLIVPVKKKKNAPPLGLFDEAFNSLHASMRQPIESLIAWLNNKTRIEDASKIRSVNGLFAQVALKMIAALLLLIFNF